MPFVSGHGSARCNTIENSLGHLQEPPASVQSQRQITPTAVAPPRSKCASSYANPQKQAPCPQIPIDRTRCTSEPNAPALSSLGAFPTPANTPRHPRDRVASENLHISRHWLTVRANKDRVWVADLNVDRPNAEQRRNGRRDRARLRNAHASTVKNLHQRLCGARARSVSLQP